MREDTDDRETAFQQAMLATPDDMHLRMVFADWLEERGDPRGELLRLTHKLTHRAEFLCPKCGPVNRGQTYEGESSGYGHRGCWQGVKPLESTNEMIQRDIDEIRLQQLVHDGVQAVGPFWTNSIGMQFVWIPPGVFMMGSPPTEPGRYEDERQHRVTIERGFWMQTTPVTQAQWYDVMQTTPSHFRSTGIGGQGHRPNGRLPVESVSWDDCQEFCKQLSERENYMDKMRFREFRLPSEACWEYACRTGTTSAYHFGNDPACLGDYAWYADNSASRTHPAGQKKPNGFGLYDMYGNVWEWCQDVYGQHGEDKQSHPFDVAVADAGQVNSSGQPSGVATVEVSGTKQSDSASPSNGKKVLRGGAHRNIPVVCRSAYRGSVRFDVSDDYLSFRICFSR